MVGVGKTTLAHEICIRWADGKLGIDDFDIVILVNLREVQQRSLEEVVSNLVGKKAYELLRKSTGSKCLLILEGLDEMAPEQQKTDPFLVRIKDCTLLENATIIITSRPHVCQDVHADRKLEVVGFCQKEISKFLHFFFENDSHQVTSFLEHLKEHPQLHGLCYVPVCLVMIADMFKINHKLPSSLTELYTLFVLMKLERQAKKNNIKYSPSEERVSHSTEAVLYRILGNVPVAAVKIVLSLSRLCYHGFFTLIDAVECKNNGPKVIFTKEELIQCEIEVNEQFDGYGLLNAVPVHGIPRDTFTYNFVHLTVQEFLCAIYIATLPEEEQLKLLKTYFSNHLNVIAMYCGITRLESDEAFRFVYSMLTSAADDLGVTVTAACRCLCESGKQSPPQLTQRPFTLCTSYNTLMPYDCLCISYCLSHFPVSLLDLGWCHISDKGAEQLAKHYTASKHSRLLSSLILKYNSLTAEGLKHIVKIIRSKFKDSTVHVITTL